LFFFVVVVVILFFDLWLGASSCTLQEGLHPTSSPDSWLDTSDMTVLPLCLKKKNKNQAAGDVAQWCSACLLCSIPSTAKTTTRK
jgi:hypothetical protein